MPEVNVGHLSANLSEFGPVDIPYWDVKSGEAGPVLLVTAAQHGNEVHGCEVVRRFVLMVGQELQRGQVLVSRL
jgi:predicted deacylase